MSLQSQIVSDASLFLNLADFASSVTYNGAALTAVVEAGETLTKGNGYSTDGLSDPATIWVSATAVASPEVGDVIVSGAKSWAVMRVLSSDDGLHQLQCAGNVTPFRGGAR